MQTRFFKRYRRLVLLAVGLAFTVIMLGAYTRLVDAGLGCPDWPGCYGFLTVPHSVHDIALAAQRYPESPVEHHKGWPEMVHRYAASSLGLMIFSIAALSLWRRRLQDKALPLGLPLALAALVVCQGLFGMWTVTLKLWPQVVSAHLLGGFTTLSLLFLLWLRLSGSKDKTNVSNDQNVSNQQSVSNYQNRVIFGLLLVVAQIFLGAWTAANYAALACPDFPTCQGAWLPGTDFSNAFHLTQHVGPNYLGGQLDNDARVTIHLTHRLGALLVTSYWLVLSLQMLKSNPEASIRRAIYFVLAALTLQVGLGVLNVLLLIPLPVALLHNLGGACLLLMIVQLTYRVFDHEKRLANVSVKDAFVMAHSNHPRVEAQ